MLLTAGFCFERIATMEIMGAKIINSWEKSVLSAKVIGIHVQMHI